MTALQTIAVAFAMFSALPMPQFDWNEKKYAVRALRLPAGGGGVRRTVVRLRRAAAACGGRAAGLCLVPVWVTGGIHLDGYADTCDALSSYGDTAKKLEILKDPRLRRVRGHPAVQLLCGVFCAVRLCGVHPAGRRALDAGAGGGAGAVRAGRGGVPAGEKTPALPTPLPRRRTASACGRCWPYSAPCWPWG